MVPQKGQLNMRFKPEQATFTVSTEILRLEKPFELQSYEIKGAMETKLENPFTVALIQGS